MTFQLKEVVYLTGMVEEFEHYNGIEVRVIGPAYLQSITNGGESKFKFGHSVSSPDGAVWVIHPTNLTRMTPARGDMDRLITWDYLFQTTGFKRRDEDLL
jgi:hypothetical protein